MESGRGEGKDDPPSLPSYFRSTTSSPVLRPPSPTQPQARTNPTPQLNPHSYAELSSPPPPAAVRHASRQNPRALPPPPPPTKPALPTCRLVSPPRRGGRDSSRLARRSRDVSAVSAVNESGSAGPTLLYRRSSARSVPRAAAAACAPAPRHKTLGGRDGGRSETSQTALRPHCRAHRRRKMRPGGQVRAHRDAGGARAADDVVAQGEPLERPVVLQRVRLGPSARAHLSGTDAPWACGAVAAGGCSKVASDFDRM